MKNIPCGGCGNADPGKRCFGCHHNFSGDYIVQTHKPRDPAAIREAALREAAAVATACERQNHARVSDSETHGIYRLGLEAAGQAIAAGILALIDKKGTKA